MQHRSFDARCASIAQWPQAFDTPRAILEGPPATVTFGTSNGQSGSSSGTTRQPTSYRKLHLSRLVWSKRHEVQSGFESARQYALLALVS